MACKPAWKNSVLNNADGYLKVYRQQLLEAMKESGVNSEEMINKGMKAARAGGNPFLPAPGEFCRWCLPMPEDFGMPSLSVAWEEARTETGKAAQYRKWSHPAVYLAAASTGFFELKACGGGDQRYRDIKKRFTEHYERMVEKVISGKELSVPKEFQISKDENKFNRKKADKVAATVVSSLLSEL